MMNDEGSMLNCEMGHEEESAPRIQHFIIDH